MECPHKPRICSLPPSRLFPTFNQRFLLSPNNNFYVKFFLVVFIAYIVPFFYLNFILSVHTGHPDFDFNWCLIFTEYFFSFEKVWMVKTTPHQIPTHPIKKLPWPIISHSSAPWCSIFTEYFFSFEKVWMVKTTPHQIPTHPIKKSPGTIIFHSSLHIHLANTTWKTLIPCFLPVIRVASSEFWPY